MTGPPDLSPREAVERWLNKLRVNHRDQTVSTYWYRLKLFVEWCEEEEVEYVDDLTPWQIETYETQRREHGPEITSLNNEMQTLNQWLEWLASKGIVTDELPESVHVPTVPTEEQSDDLRLPADRAIGLLRHYRATPQSRATRGHALLELAWHTGARMGGLRSLDVRDVHHLTPDELREIYQGSPSHPFAETSDSGAYYVDFRNRTETNTPLKKALNGERAVHIQPTVYEVVRDYIDNKRIDVRDQEGRKPLLSSQQGRPATSTIREWMYQATLPCNAGSCPHERDPPTCEWTSYTKSSSCPSSRSPHQVRTGAITWMLSQGVPIEVVARRVNASVRTIKKHYDKEQHLSEMVNRRLPHVADLSIEETDS